MIYLDNAATSWPKPESVYRAMDRFARESAGNPGRSGHRLALEAERAVAEARRRLATLLNAESPTTVLFALNGTDALNIAIRGLRLSKGDHVVTTELEHNSVNRPLGRLHQREGVQLSKARAGPAGIVEPEEIRRLLRSNTRLIVATHASNVTGVVQPVEAHGQIARERGIPFLVDAAQTAGVVEIDVRRMNADLIAFPGHKNLFGPMGTGALYVRQGLALDFFREGGTGVNSEVELQPDEMPFRLEAGTPNAVGIAGLAAGLEFVEQQRLERIRLHENRLAMKFLEHLRRLKRVRSFGGAIPDRQLGPVSFTVDGLSTSEAGAILDQRFGIACRTGLHCAPGTHRWLGTFPDGTLRFSFGWFNTEAEVDEAARAVEELATAVS